MLGKVIRTAVSQYADDVRKANFPAEQEIFKLSSDEYNKLKEDIDFVS